jgi:predicted dehydrogenase
MTVGLGIVGIESYYGQAYAELADQRADVDVVAAMTTYTDGQLRELDRRTAAAFAETFDCSVQVSVEPVLSSQAVDAVVVGTPTTRRADDAVRAIESGRHVLTAKPAADSPEAARAIAEAARGTDLLATTTAPHRFDDAICGIKGRIDRETFGETHAIRTKITHPRAIAGRTSLDPEYGSGEAGAVYLMGYYTADALRWLADGRPDSLSGLLQNVNTPYSDHPDLGSATVEFDDGCVGTMMLTYSTDGRSRHGNWEVEVVGTNGVARNRHEGYEGIAWTATDIEETEVELFGRRQPPVLRRQLDEFVDAVRDDPSLATRSPDPESVVHAFELCAAWEECVGTNSRVDL